MCSEVGGADCAPTPTGARHINKECAPGRSDTQAFSQTVLRHWHLQAWIVLTSNSGIASGYARRCNWLNPGLPGTGRPALLTPDVARIAAGTASPGCARGPFAGGSVR